ncbi:PKD domain-containing protein [Kitasatospora aureofaciens]|uniref:PKD domain-containing protein n=1 Tax=Kitasatospora aureofaciens TaxID=1894 RepID=UPI003808DD62
MRISRALGLTVASATVVLGAPLPAFADPATTLYVNNAKDANCSDAGTGTQAQPFCTISKAAQVVEAGQTVQILGSAYQENVSLTRSGTPDKPITFVGSLFWGYDRRQWPTALDDGSTVLTITGVHDVNIRHLLLSSSAAAVVTDSQRVTFDQVVFNGWNTSQPQLRVKGTSDHLTVSRSRFLATGGVSADPGTHDVLLTTNEFNAAYSGISATDSPGLTVTNNTFVNACGPAVALNGASTKSSVQNNVVTYGVPGGRGPFVPNCSSTGAPSGPALTVAAGSADGTTVDYNVVHPQGTQAAYAWSGTSYATPQALTTATGQGRNDVNQEIVFNGQSAELVMTDADTSVIDTANPNAPGVLPTDLRGVPAMHSPLVPAGSGNSTGRDRGAREVQSLEWATLNMSGAGSPTPKGPAPLTVTATASVKSNWGTKPTTYVFDFRDGTPPVTSSTPTVEHTYTAVGDYSPIVTVQDELGGQVVGDGSTAIVGTSGPLTVSIDTVNQTGKPLEYSIQGSVASPWNVGTVSVDPGDGSAPIPLGYTHTYPRPGTYTVTLTATDEGGRTASTSKTVNVDYTAATKDLFVGERVDVIADTRPAYSPDPNLPNVTEARANHTSGTWRPWAEIPMSAAYAYLDRTRMASAYTADGNLHLVRAQDWRLETADWHGKDLKWTNFFDLQSNPLDGTAPTQLAVAAMGNKLHVLTVVRGRVYQNTADYAAGRWGGWADVTAAAGITTPITQIAAGSTGNVLHIAMVDAQGQVRVAEGDYDRGTWWSGALPAQLGNPSGTTQLAAAAVGSKFHVLALAGGSVYQATADYAAGSWNGWANISAVTGLAGGVTKLAAAGTGNSLRLYALSSGHIYNATGDYAKGAWYPWADVTASGAAGPSAPVNNLTAAGTG